MPVWGWILIVAAVVAVGVAIGAAIAANRRKRTERLKDRFGPEYERTVNEAGEQRVAEKELAAREKSRSKLDIHPLTARGAGRLREPLADGADRVRRQPVGRGGRSRSARHRGDARAWLPGRRLQPAGGRHLGRPPDGRRELPRRTRHPPGAAEGRRRHRTAAPGVRPLPRAVREVARNRRRTSQRRHAHDHTRSARRSPPADRGTRSAGLPDAEPKYSAAEADPASSPREPGALPRRAPPRWRPRHATAAAGSWRPRPRRHAAARRPRRPRWSGPASTGNPAGQPGHRRRARSAERAEPRPTETSSPPTNSPGSARAGTTSRRGSSTIPKNACTRPTASSPMSSSSSPAASLQRGHGSRSSGHVVNRPPPRISASR